MVSLQFTKERREQVFICFKKNRRDIINLYFVLLLVYSSLN